MGLGLGASAGGPFGGMSMCRGVLVGDRTSSDADKMLGAGECVLNSFGAEALVCDDVELAWLTCGLLVLAFGEDSMMMGGERCGEGCGEGCDGVCDGGFGEVCGGG